MKKINVEEIKNKERFQNIKYLTKEEVKTALDFVITKIDENMEYFGEDKFPSASSINGVYDKKINKDWTNGFWTGMLWLAYEYTGKEKYKNLAEKHVVNFKQRLDDRIVLEHHDLGFLYSLSTVAAYKLTGDEFAKKVSIEATEYLIRRYQEKGGFIQAWGPLGEEKSYRLIIDCLLNIPLLYWTSEETGDKKYYDMAYTHYKSTINNIIREDASTYHTYYFNPETGNPVKGVTRQGYSDESCWARGQAWGVYGLPLTYKYTKDQDALNLYPALTNYFLNRLPKDLICYWDLIFTDKDNQVRDSSSAAIAACGIFEMNKYYEGPDKEIYLKAAHGMLRELINNYTTKDEKSSNGVLMHSVYAYVDNLGIDECSTWGDYFYMEALIRLVKDWNLYW
ncbi:unsaturated chondroitin disaccharide hydrolase [Clostridium cavendishii DSM 21758]|uniref:Unsaturated chondroitin disaccharide hydrolase n=1 Tax=Clostridium cavendishii DSM 21758 TaxID=1121302 RepID=A0A1M6US27_9CLOT|nr:glycoside hydrolase family 88 protein [Clostridium cavendishii]SHK71983.1 unsaturated chondroitin disaccharide hydrolase [Clostridium cavendishii DSM 21758]